MVIPRSADKFARYVNGDGLVACCGGETFELPDDFGELEYFWGTLGAVAYGGVAITCKCWPIEMSLDTVV